MALTVLSSAASGADAPGDLAGDTLCLSPRGTDNRSANGPVPRVAATGDVNNNISKTSAAVTAPSSSTFSPQITLDTSLATDPPTFSPASTFTRKSPFTTDSTDSARPSTSPASSHPQSPSLLSPPIISRAANAASGSYFGYRRQSSGSDTRSPYLKRPPASRSSHGIETSRGPPPALSTQRSPFIESWRFVPPSQDPFSPPPQDLTQNALARFNALKSKEQKPKAQEKFDGKAAAEEEEERLNESAIIDDDDEEDEAVEDRRSEMANTAMRAQIRYTSEEPTLRESRRNSLGLTSRRLGTTGVSSRPSHDASQPTHEDLFLDLAKTDSQDGSVDSTRERRRSQIGMSRHRHTTSQPFIDSRNIVKDEPSYSSPIGRDRRASLQRPEINSHQPLKNPASPERSRSMREGAHSSAATAAEQRYRSRIAAGTLPKPILVSSRSSQARDESPETPSLLARRQSIPDGSYTGRYRSHLQQNNYYSSPLARAGTYEAAEPSPTQQARQEGTESTVSTTAPSTVWDELDELKTRLRKLEIAGRSSQNPPSAGYSSTSERPRTATTTTATTMSSSPKRLPAQNLSPVTSVIDGDEGSLHPLLTSAMQRSKTYVSGEVFGALEASVADALSLSKLAGQQGSLSATDRQIRRKADSMCRSLTELCIALSEERPGSRYGRTPNRPTSSRDGSRNRYQLSIDPQQQQDDRSRRSGSLDPEPSSARVFSRLEARRISLMGTPGSAGGSGSNSRSSPTKDGNLPLHDSTTPTQSHVSRAPTVVQRSSRNGEGSEDNDTTIRPFSRAQTDLAATSTTPVTTTVAGPAGGSGGPLARTSRMSNAAKRQSREYTSSYPLPSPSSWSPAAQNALQGRSYFAGGATTASNAAPSQLREKALPQEPDVPPLPGTALSSSIHAPPQQQPQSQLPPPPPPHQHQQAVNLAADRTSTLREPRRSFLERYSGASKSSGGDDTHHHQQSQLQQPQQTSMALKRSSIPTAAALTGAAGGTTTTTISAGGPLGSPTHKRRSSLAMRLGRRKAVEGPQDLNSGV